MDKDIDNNMDESIIQDLNKVSERTIRPENNTSDFFFALSKFYNSFYYIIFNLIQLCIIIS